MMNDSSNGRRRKIRRSGLGIACLGLIGVLLAGCMRVQRVDPDLTVDRAKTDVLAEGKRVVSVIPEKYVEEYRQLDTAYLLACTSDSYSWPDQGEVTFKGDPDIRGLMTEIAEHYRNKPGFDVRIEKAWDGDDMVVLKADDGANYYLTVWSDGVLHVDSFSACFTLDEDQWPGDAY
ncbi:hypothetical protein [Leifsonia sp. NPDC058248]|uniref:hypothetical protein n=1 Tax=Leifsonia sp. NPDC058248 TaxID=3346402 RepID=UPI0036D899B2